MNRRDKKRVFRKAAELIRDERLYRESISAGSELLPEFRATWCCQAIEIALGYVFPANPTRGIYKRHPDEEELLTHGFIKTMAPDKFNGAFFMPAVHKNAKHREVLLLMYAEML